MADHVIHISEAEAARDFSGLLARVRAGAEVVIENNNHPENSGTDGTFPIFLIGQVSR
jgi:hypothetical protein